MTTDTQRKKARAAARGSRKRARPDGSLPSGTELLALFTRQARPMALDALLSVTGLPRRARRGLEDALRELEHQGLLVRLSGGRWARPGQLKCLVGRFRAARSASGDDAGGFVSPLVIDASMPGAEPGGDGPDPGEAGVTESAGADATAAPVRRRRRGSRCCMPTEIHIRPARRNGAWHGDLVRVALEPERAPRARGRHGGHFRQSRDTAHMPEGRVLEVLERGLRQVPVHLVRRDGDTLFCRPADARVPVDFSVRLTAPIQPGTPAPDSVPPDSGTPGPDALVPGALLLVEPVAELASTLWSARLLGAYGREDDVDVQEQLAKLNHEVPREFPPASLAEAAALPSAPSASDLALREDVRELPLVTIDGADARDFDDAVHVERRGNGWLLRVAIADVSHYVRPAGGRAGDGLAGVRAGALDAEALARGNSWYFPRSVEPMLPPALSNGLCSLRPEEDRLAVLAEIPFDAAGHPGQARFSPVVMRSAARLTYDAVRDALLAGDAAARARIAALPRGAAVLTMLEEAFALYRLLRAARMARGSLDFELPEPRYTVDTQGRVLEVGVEERHDAHRLIEEFMIAANEAVARRLGGTDHAGRARGEPGRRQRLGTEVLYRVHPEPDPERLESLFATLAATAVECLPPGFTAADARNGRGAGRLREVLARAAGTPQEYVVNRLCLRALPQARYQPENTGHFGLASTAYCHFTSPIRRYADLLTHRALKAALGLPAGPIPAGQRLVRIADQLNRRERAAQDCEREMARRLACLWLSGREGDCLDGVVSGVTHFGLFVELSGVPVEGMVRLEDLGDDWYGFDQERQQLTGERHGRVWRLGQPLRVRLARVDMERLEIRLLPLSAPSGREEASGRDRAQRPRLRRDGRDHAAGSKHTRQRGARRSGTPGEGRSHAGKARGKTARGQAVEERGHRGRAARRTGKR